MQNLDEEGKAAVEKLRNLRAGTEFDREGRDQRTSHSARRHDEGGLKRPEDRARCKMQGWAGYLARARSSASSAISSARSPMRSTEPLALRGVAGAITSLSR
jgi:hypothetical protein